MKAVIEGNVLHIFAPLTGSDLSLNKRSVKVAETQGFEKVENSVLKYKLVVIEPNK